MSGHFSVKGSAIQGWYFDPNDAPGACVDLYCGDIFLRRLRCDLAWPAPPTDANVQRPCGFSLNVTESLAKLLPDDQQFTIVKPNGEQLNCKGEVAPFGSATDGGAVLRERLAQGWIVDKWGSLKLPFQAVKGLDQRYLDFYCNTSAKLQAELDIEFYLVYGSLLGCVRDGKLIPFDDDIDVAYMSEYSNVLDVAREFHEIKARLQAIASSLSIDIGVVETGQLSVVAKDLHFDIFTSWIDENQVYNCYFGVSGALDEPSLALKKVPLLGCDVTIPVRAERVIEWTYGPGWKVPDPHFKWVPAPEVKKIMDGLRESGRKYSDGS